MFYSELRSQLMAHMTACPSALNDTSLQELVTALINLDDKLAALKKIEDTVSDDQCCDLEWDRTKRPERLTPREQMLADKIGEVYRLSHACDDTHSCYSAHENWRI